MKNGGVKNISPFSRSARGAFFHSYPSAGTHLIDVGSLMVVHYLIHRLFCRLNNSSCRRASASRALSKSIFHPTGLSTGRFLLIGETRGSDNNSSGVLLEAKSLMLHQCLPRAVARDLKLYLVAMAVSSVLLWCARVGPLMGTVITADYEPNQQNLNCQHV
jgi:hypothetical protein